MNDKQLQEAAEYTEGICGEAAAILKDGVMMTIPEILKELNSRVEPIAVPLSVKSGEEKEFDKLQIAFQKQAQIKDEYFLEIERLKGLIREAWQQSIINCEAENGIGEEPYKSWQKFKSENNL